MAYATSSDISDRYGSDFVARSFDKTGDGLVDSSVVEKALDDATADIDTYLAARYSLPLASTPAILTRICGDIAIYRGSGEAGTVTDEKRQRYEDAMSWLRELAKGVVSLGVVSPPESTGGSASVSYPNSRLFTRTTMRDL